MNREITVKLDGREVIVKKLPIGKYAEVFTALQELPKKLGSIDSLSNEEFIARIPILIAEALPELTKVMSVATGVPEKQILTLGLDEVTDLVAAILDVNNFEKVVANVKKIMARNPSAKATK